MLVLPHLTGLIQLILSVTACSDDDWFSPVDPDYLGVHANKLVKRVQPGADAATTTKPDPLHWGQVNFLATTDTHGWLAGHLLDPNYSADFGDFSSFVYRMKLQAKQMGVDLLLVDSGDLHDGTGLSDTTDLDGALTNPIFEKLPYDLLSIGNHELYVSGVALDTYHNFAPNWRGNYLTSNVEIYDDITGELVPLSDRYRHFTTEHGVRIQSFGFLFNFTGNSNQSVVTPVGVAVNQTWFQDQVSRQDIDLFVIVGHIPVRSSTEWNLVYAAIRAHHPTTPIQIFGGHNHIRDFAVYDASATALSAGRYCETVGWVSIDGLNSSTARPSRTNGTKIATVSSIPGTTPNRNSTIGITRQYLDFNPVTFEYHTNTTNTTFADARGKNITTKLTQLRLQQNLTSIIGCSPGNYYLNRYPLNSTSSLFDYLTTTVFPSVVFSPNRTDQPRLILTNTGGFRYDLLEGQFTIDQAYQVNPYQNFWLYMTVPWSSAKNLLTNMQTDRVYKRDVQDSAALVDGYVTTDDLGKGGDNTPHVPIGYYPTPHYVQGNASLPANPADDLLVDVYATSFFTAAAGRYLTGNVTDWTTAEPGFTSYDTLPRMAARFWDKSCVSSS
ncbi:Phosphoprotein phosphatase [Taphrina deformans PYCC 5710]|uniref:Phosphoprotein phosphatase n=1 Tax=Taphrina deformans (strain PYCC 5710 / ATCC 11124 / CBS 356.35 / IMI 108563 / JCM 9778 / NBRC 8474) TaxID=1097556 RepID=R4X6N9_TAPDE|nr:Phosphoprotein phosphatase [Taphrina deformans PYCC 5710]|eukprot:CCG80847.1 Phosphoprotein phosphatase [Taphrina deformans PYCC 5710]